VIAIVSSNSRERAAFAALCDGRDWPWAECDTVAALKKELRQNTPTVVLARHKLADGYSDDAIKLLATAGLLPAVYMIVLIEAGASHVLEARQVALGADYVHRDPVRSDVLLEYLARFRQLATASPAPVPRTGRREFSFAGARLDPTERTLRRGAKHAWLTPREVELAECLFDAQGQVVTYASLYHGVLGRRFRGDTSNMRVLLARLTGSFASLGLALRRHVDVIPKSGYRYRASARGARTFL